MDQPALFRNSSTTRNELFARLKPCCVEISKLVMRQADQPGNNIQLLRLTEELCGILSRQAEYDASALDPKIAEYVFFPLSYIFKNKEKHTSRVIENSIKCLRILIRHGWRSTLAANLAQQLLILLTFIIAGVPGQERGPGPPEETVLECYRTLADLLRASALSGPVAEALVEANSLPSLGHAVTVILEGVTDGQNSDIQLAALDALGSLFTMKDRAVLASFLPGTVSALSRLLAPPSSLKAQKRVLVHGLQVLKDILGKLLGDIHNRSSLKQLEGASNDTEGASSEVLSASWLKATAAQIKLALANILKLRNHESDEVQLAVEALCIALLDECHSTLADCALFLVESTIITWKEVVEAAGPDVSQPGGLQGLLRGSASQSGLELRTTLQDLALIYPELQDVLKTVVFNWTNSLPRIMQTSDETVKQQSLRSLMKGYRLIEAMQLDSSTLHDALSTALRDSVVSLTQSANLSTVMREVDADEEDWGSSALVRPSTELKIYKPVLLPQGSQKDTRDALVDLVANFGSPNQQVQLAADMLGFVRDSYGVDQVTAYWLAFELVKAALARSTDLDCFVDFSISDSSNGPEEIFRELFSFSGSILASDPDLEEADWRLEAIALEVTAFAANRLQQSFKPELIDVLFPIATFLGSQSPLLRRHAITTLNILASSCGYGSVSELIIDNVDYMVTSVSLRLNTFDITPATTRVLKMMIRLTGPTLVPFLGDVVEAIFTALDNYHGYPVFVESLFDVLSEMVEQGVKSDVLLLEDGHSKAAVEHKKKPPQAASISQIQTEVIEKRAQKRKRDLEDDEANKEAVRGHPEAPWKSQAEEFLEKRQRELEAALEGRGEGEGQGEEEEQEASESNEPVDDDEEKPEPTPTYKLLKRVATLTQHYLTSPTPTLRKSLLDLLATVSSAMALDEEAFLPLVNTLWPVMISRLHDPEPYVVVAACKAISALAQGCGDFLGSRIKTEWWESLGSWCRRAKNEARKAQATAAPRGGGGSRTRPLALPGRSLVGEEIVLPHRTIVDSGGELQMVRQKQSHHQLHHQQQQEQQVAGSTGLGRFAQAALVWEGAVELLVAILSYVQIENEIFDEILDLLADSLAENEAAREALEVVNADAVWLAMYESGTLQDIPPGPTPVPVADGDVPVPAFVRLEAVRG